MQAVGDDLLPDRGLAVFPLAQHFGVIDLPQLHMPAGHRRPCARDAAFVPNRLRCSRQEEKEGAPRLGIAAGVDRELADEMTVQQRGELDHGCVRPERGTIVEQQAVGQDGES